MQSLNLSLFYPTTLSIGDYCHKTSLALVTEEEQNNFLDQLVESPPEADANHKSQVITYALKEIFFRKILQKEEYPFYFDLGPRISFQEDEITHDHWIQRCVELLNVSDENQSLAQAKIKQIFDVGISAVIGELPPAESGYVNMRMMVLGNPTYQQCLQPLTRTIRFAYNKIDSSGHTALDKLIQKVNLSVGELNLVEMLLLRDARIASTSVEKLKEFKAAVQATYPQVCQNLQFEARINYLAQTKLSGLLSVKEEKQR